MRCKYHCGGDGPITCRPPGRDKAKELGQERRVRDFLMPQPPSRPAPNHGPILSHALCGVLSDPCMVHGPDACRTNSMCGWCASRRLCVDALNPPLPVSGDPSCPEWTQASRDSPGVPRDRRGDSKAQPSMVSTPVNQREDRVLDGSTEGTAAKARALSSQTASLIFYIVGKCAIQAVRSSKPALLKGMRYGGGGLSDWQARSKANGQVYVMWARKTADITGAG